MKPAPSAKTVPSATLPSRTLKNAAAGRLTLLPLADKIFGGIAAGMAPWFDGASIAVDLDRVPALSEDRERLWKQVSEADFLTPEERRAMLGLAPMEGSR